MRIGFDVDEVLAVFVDPFLDFYNHRYGTSFSREDVTCYNFWEVFGITKGESIREVHDFYRSKAFERILSVKGSVEAAAILSKGNELVSVTSRPDRIGDQTNSFIDTYFPGNFSAGYSTNQWTHNGDGIKKSVICLREKIGVFVEDSIEYAEDCASVGVKVLLLDCPWNQKDDLPANIQRVKSWDEVLEILK